MTLMNIHLQNAQHIYFSSFIVHSDISNVLMMNHVNKIVEFRENCRTTSRLPFTLLLIYDLSGCRACELWLFSLICSFLPGSPGSPGWPTGPCGPISPWGPASPSLPMNEMRNQHFDEMKSKIYYFVESKNENRIITQFLQRVERISLD